jgi:WD40 repeat protein
VAVRASLPPNWVDAELAIEPQAKEQRQGLRLEHSAEYFANQADGLVAGNAVPEEAITALAAAINQKPETYAQLPEPIVAVAGSRAITALSVTESGRRLTAASSDGAIRAWAIDGDTINRTGVSVARTGGEVENLAATDDWIAAIAVTEERETVVAAGPDGQTHELTVPDATGVKQIAISGDGRTLVAAAELLELLPPQRRAWSLHAWRLDAADVAASHEVLATVEGEFDPRLAVAHRQPWAAVATTDGERWFLRICPLQAELAPAPIYEQHGDLKAVAVSPDDRRIAVGGDAVSDDEDAVDFRATVVDVDSQRHQTLTRSHGARIDAAAFDAAGTLLATGDVDGHAQAWALPAEWAAAAPPPADPVFLRDGAGDMTSLACPRPGWTACCVGGRVALWDCAPGNPQFVELGAADSAATKVAATPDGRWLIVGHDDGTLRFWNLPRVILAFRAAAKAGVPLRGNAPGDDEA